MDGSELGLGAVELTLVVPTVVRSKPRRILPVAVAAMVATGGLVGFAVSGLFNDGKLVADMLGGVLAVTASAAGGAWGERIRRRRRQKPSP